MTTWPEVADWIFDHSPGIISALGSTLAATAAVLVAYRQIKNGAQLVNINLNVEGVRHDLRNGVGDSIAAKTAAHVVPVVKEVVPAVKEIVEGASKSATKEITTEVARSNAEVAVALAEKQSANWDGVERRNGPPDRRGQ